MKYIEDGIWELRPGNNRVLYFFFKDKTFILLHQFRKKNSKNAAFGNRKSKIRTQGFFIKRGA